MGTFVRPFGVALAAALLACSDDASSPTPTPAPTETPARALVTDAPLGLAPENLFADPTFRGPRFTFGAFFAATPASLQLLPLGRIVSWDAPYGRRSPALTVTATEAAVIGAFFTPPTATTYRASVWLAGGVDLGGAAAPLPENVRVQVVLATGKSEVAALTVGPAKEIGSRTWVPYEAIFSAAPIMHFLQISLPKGTVLVAAPEVTLATARRSRSLAAPTANPIDAPWVASLAARLPSLPPNPRPLPPRFSPESR